MRVESVPDPSIEQDSDVVIEVTSSGLCGSDLHLYEVLGPFLHPGDILGHEPMGRIVEKGAAVTRLEIGDRVVVPFQIACGHCFMCDRGLQTQCEQTQVTQFDKGAQIFGYTDLYGAVPGAQAEYLRVPYADYGPVKIPDDGSDDRYLLLSDVLPTALQGLEYSEVRSDETLVVLGLGPIGEMAARIALHRGIRVVGVDLVPERLSRSASLGVEVIDLRSDDVSGQVRDRTSGRGADAVIDAVGLEAHGSPVSTAAHRLVGLLPPVVSRPLMVNAGIDRMAALHLAVDVVRRGGTVSLSGVYAGALDPMPMQQIFDKQLRLHMGQANVRRWVEDLLPLIEDRTDPLGLESFVTHHVPLEDASAAYRMFQQKADGAIKMVFVP